MDILEGIGSPLLAFSHKLVHKVENVYNPPLSYDIWPVAYVITTLLRWEWNAIPKGPGG